MRQPMEWDRLCHPIAKAVTQNVWTDIDEFGDLDIFFDDIAQSTF